MPDHNGRPILWQPSPRQSEFLAASEDEVLFGGAAGGGKSDALMFDCLGLQFEALKWDKYRAIVFRKTYPETEQLFDRAAYYYPKIWAGVKANKSDHEFIFPSGAKVAFGYMEREKDRFRYQGDEYQYVGWDALTLWKHDTAYDFLGLFRARSTNPRIPVLIRATTNPGNVGHAWVKKRFRVPNDGKGSRFISERTVTGPDGAPVTVRRSMRFIPSKLNDNTQAPDSFRQAYRNSLLMLTEKDRRKFLDGRWDVMEGQFFTEWDPARHIVQPFEIPRDWPRWRAMDWGTAKPYSVGWYAMDFNGVIYRYRELYGYGGEPNVGTRETAATVAERVKAAEADERRKKIQFLNNPADSAMWGQVGHEKSIADEFTSRGIGIRKSSAAEKSRQSGWNECRQRLADGTFKVFASGEHFIRTIPDLQCDPDKDGDLMDDGEDHAADEWRYSMASRRPKARKDTRQSPPPPTSGAYLDWIAEQKRQADAGRLTGRIR
jgi:hypothetical protein